MLKTEYERKKQDRQNKETAYIITSASPVEGFELHPHTNTREQRVIKSNAAIISSPVSNEVLVKNEY